VADGEIGFLYGFLVLGGMLLTILPLFLGNLGIDANDYQLGANSTNCTTVTTYYPPGTSALSSIITWLPNTIYEWVTGNDLTQSTPVNQSTVCSTYQLNTTMAGGMIDGSTGGIFSQYVQGFSLIPTWLYLVIFVPFLVVLIYVFARLVRGGG
jgi:hypothetical protein